MTIQPLPPTRHDPHVVILGAGASRAAFPRGEKNGKKLPLMNDLIDALGLEPVLKEAGIEFKMKDFEALYSELSVAGNRPDLLARIERTVFDYFARLELSDQPTLYDHLVLSLRSKDLIATFNWDPFLTQALYRIGKRFGEEALPSALYLHGNVAIGYCHKHEPPTLGVRGYSCGKCGSKLIQSKLLYPVAEKNYNQDPSISISWDEVRRFLKHAFLLTIFGYRAPHTDAEAIALMKDAWGDVELRSLEQIEIIDIQSEDALYDSWKTFICRNHYYTWDDFYHSYAARYPRRSCENHFETYLQNNPQHERPIPRGENWDAIEAFINPLIEQEV